MHNKTKMRFYKKTWFWILMISIVLLSACVSGLNKSEQKTEELNINEAHEESVTNSEPDNASVPFNHEAEIKGVSISINSVEDAQEIVDDSGFLSYNPENEAAKYVVLQVTIANNSNEAVHINSSDFKISLDGAEYVSSMLLGMNEYIDFLTLNPGIHKVGKIAFELPIDKDATLGQIKYTPNFFLDNFYMFDLK